MDFGLVKTLRWLGDHASFDPHMHHVAADRIEKLEAAMKAVIHHCEDGYSSFSDIRDTARKALEEKEPLEWTENYGQGSEPWLNKE
jgi:hypothetical protein